MAAWRVCGLGEDELEIGHRKPIDIKGILICQCKTAISDVENRLLIPLASPGYSPHEGRRSHCPTTCTKLIGLITCNQQYGAPCSGAYLLTEHGQSVTSLKQGNFHPTRCSWLRHIPIQQYTTTSLDSARAILRSILVGLRLQSLPLAGLLAFTECRAKGRGT